MKKKNQIRILLVEDEVLIAMNEKIELENYGYSVIHLTTGEKAVPAALGDSEIDLILLDIDLGKGMDGTEAARLILQKRDIPVVFLSSHIEKKIIDKTEEISSYGYIVKNSGITVLDASIKMAMRLWRSRNDIDKLQNDYHSIFTEMLDGFALHEIIRDKSGNPVNYRFLEINPAFEKITGLNRKIIGKTVLEIIPDIEQYWIETYGNVALTGKPVFFEQYAKGLDKYFQVRAYKPEEGQFACLFIDITKRKKFEIENRGIKYNDLFEKMSQGVVYHRKDGTVIATNPAAGKILGLTEDQLLGKTSMHPRWKSIHEDGSDYPGEEHPAMVSLKTGKPVKDEIMGVYIPEKNEYLWIQVSSHPQFTDDEEKPSLVFVTFTDLTELKHSKEEVERLLSEKEIILGEVHHRIKNNMNTIQILLRMQGSMSPSREVKEALRDAENRLSSMMVLYETLYEHKTIKRKVSLSEYLGSLMDRIIPIFSRPVAVKKEMKDIIVSESTASPLGIIINELITNSMKYAFTDSISEPTLTVKLYQQNDTISLHIIDNGIGFTPETECEGFGNNLVKSMAQQLRGSFQIKTSSGTECVITFPIEKH